MTKRRRSNTEPCGAPYLNEEDLDFSLPRRTEHLNKRNEKFKNNIPHALP